MQYGFLNHFVDTHSPRADDPQPHHPTQTASPPRYHPPASRKPHVIITTAGLHAIIRGIADTTVELETSPGVVSTWEKHVVIKNLTQEKKAQPAAAAEPEQQPVGELPAGEQPAAEKPADDTDRAS